MAKYKIVTAIIIVLIVVMSIIAYGTIYTLKNLIGELMIKPTPIIWYEDPHTRNVSVSIKGLKANVTVKMVPPDIILKKRHAIYYNTFDESPSEFSASPDCAGYWSWDSAGHYIEVNDYSMSDWYCYFYPSNVDISSYISNGNKVYAAAIMWRSPHYSGDVIRIGFTFLNNSTWNNYLIGLYNEVVGGVTGDNANATAYYYEYHTLGRKQRWYTSTLLNSSMLGSGAVGFKSRYRHNLSAGIDFSKWDAGLWSIGRTVNSPDTMQVLKAHINETYRITPNKVGVGIHAESVSYSSARIYFDNFVITVDAPPWLVNVTGLMPGWKVVLENSTGGIVDEAIAGSDGVASLEVWGYLIVPNATISVYDSNGRLIINKSFNIVVGGDVYEVNGFSDIILNIYSNMTSGFKSRLELVSTNCTGVKDTYAYIYLYNRSGYSVGPIKIENGTVTAGTTDYISMNPPGSWTNNWSAGWIKLTTYMPEGIYNIVLKQVFSPAPGTYTYGYINITIKSKLMIGNVLHVYSHDTNSSYTEIHTVNRDMGTGDTYIVEQTVLAENYSGSAGVTLLEVQVTENWGTNWYSIYWYGGNQLVIGSINASANVNIDMSKPHTYRIEVTNSKVTFYIDGDIVAEFNADIKKIDQVNCGRWDYGSTYDLYIDNVKEYWNGNIINQENFDDGTDNFYTADIYQGSGSSGEEIIWVDP